MTKHPSAYEALIDHLREIHLLESTAELLSWDQETMMPAAAVDHRANQLALLARLAHERATSDRLGDLLAKCDQGQGDFVSDTNLREAKIAYQRNCRMPAALVAEIAATSSRAQHAWGQARKDSDFASFLPWLTTMIGLMRSKAQCLRDDSMDEDWDALAEGFEPGMRAKSLQDLFRPLRDELGDLRDKLAGSQRSSHPDSSAMRLPQAQQEACVRFVAEQMGFDFSRGRMDRSTHPFCGGSHCDDVRITTRFSDDNFFDALGSTMHEAGHGIYEQGLLPKHIGTAMGTAISLGIHESQSRLWENQVGRSQAFWRWCQPRLAKFFGDAFVTVSPDDLYVENNGSLASLIRVEADESTYNFHIMIRFELELALIRGELDPADLPEAWRHMYRDYLDLEVPDDRRGCLQDVHWSCGLFGYFPTYTLGNLYAAQFFAQADADLGNLDELMAQGEFGTLRRWLNQNIHAHGMRYRAGELCSKVTTKELSSAPFLSYLRGKLEPIFGI